MDCYSCRSISGEKRISPGPIIYEGKYWIVDHAYPVGLKGWLVIVSKRHVESLHELTKEEFHEFADLLEKTTKILFQTLDCEKEYAMCLAEAEHFNHIHFHIVPKPKNLPPELKGAKVFSFLKVDKKDAVPPDEVKELCEKLKILFQN